MVRGGERKERQREGHRQSDTERKNTVRQGGAENGRERERRGFCSRKLKIVVLGLL